MSTSNHFPFFILVSLFSFVFLLKFVLRGRPVFPSRVRIAAIALIVVVGGMIFARYGATSGIPWWLYYGVPALLTLLLPPLVFRMDGRESMLYLLLAFLLSPLIHVCFSFFFGWKEYMPFIPVPSLWELVR
ncbi:MAG TPA: hypothetical protein VK832_19125 [Burkholderiaceae bacterium]|nr:hypothetical protein [Burkholderiaceae bacterium]